MRCAPSQHVLIRLPRFPVLAACVCIAIATVDTTIATAAGANAAPVPAPVGAPASVPADLVLLHGKIHTQDPARTVVQALAVRGNAIVAAGTDQAVSAWMGPNTRSVDLKCRVVLPGIID